MKKFLLVSWLWYQYWGPSISNLFIKKIWKKNVWKKKNIPNLSIFYSVVWQVLKECIKLWCSRLRACWAWKHINVTVWNTTFFFLKKCKNKIEKTKFFFTSPLFRWNEMYQKKIESYIFIITAFETLKKKKFCE